MVTKMPANVTEKKRRKNHNLRMNRDETAILMEKVNETSNI